MPEQNLQEPERLVFISYSRKDKEFVRRLNDSLDASEIEAWVDWEGIPPSSDWMDEITRAIEGSDAFLFVISPDSLASKVCGEELELGIKYNKKLVPILLRDPAPGTTMHEKLSSHNWVYLREHDDYEAGIARVLESVNVDLDWIRQHTRLLQRAREWESKDQNSSFLLQGADLDEAERWRSEAASDSNRKVVPLQTEYIDASRKTATKRQRNLLIGVSLAFVVSVFLAIYAVFQSNEANKNAIAAENNRSTAVANENLAATAQAVAETNEKQAKTNETRAIENENTAKAQRSAAEAQIYQGRTGELFTSTLLAIDSWEREQTFQAEDILRQNISQMPVPIMEANQEARINNVQFSPDGSQFVAASNTGTACLWEVASGIQVFCERFGDSVNYAFFIQNGKVVITSSLDGSVRLLDAADGSLIHRYDFDAPVLAIDVSPDGGLLAVAREDNLLSLIDLASEQSYYTLTMKSPITAVKFSPNGNWLAFGLRDGGVRMWRRSDKKLITGPKHDSEVYFVVFSPSSDWVVSVSEDSTARVASTSQGGQRYVLPHDDWLEDVAFGPANDWFVTVADDYTIRVWDTNTGKEKVRMLQEGFVQEVKVSPNGEWIASTGWDYTVRIWNTITGSERVEIPLQARGSALAFSEDGNFLLVGESNGNLSVWDVSSLNARIGYLDFPELLHEVHFSSSGDWMVVNSDDYKVWTLSKDQWFATKNGTDGESITANDLTYDMAFSPDSKWLAVAEGEASTQAILYNLQDRTLQHLEQGGKVSTVAFSSDSQQLAMAGNNKLVTIWNVATAQKAFELEHDSPVLSVAYNKDGNLLLAGLNSQIVIWDLATKSVIETLNRPGAINVLAFSHNGKMLAGSSSQGITYFWQVDGNSFSQVAEFKQNGFALALDFNPDDSLLAVGGKEGVAYLVDLSTFEEIARIPHVVEVTGVSFSNDGTYLSTVSRKLVQIWDVAKITRIARNNLVNFACSRITSNLDKTKWEYLFFGEPYRLICPNLPGEIE